MEEWLDRDDDPFISFAMNVRKTLRADSNKKNRVRRRYPAEQRLFNKRIEVLRDLYSELEPERERSSVMKDGKRVACIKETGGMSPFDLPDLEKRMPNMEDCNEPLSETDKIIFPIVEEYKRKKKEEEERRTREGLS